MITQGQHGTGSPAPAGTSAASISSPAESELEVIDIASSDAVLEVQLLMVLKVKREILALLDLLELLVQFQDLQDPEDLMDLLELLVQLQDLQGL